ncbi:hypothetical protein GNIT_0016 [Glaciecola nitratireducens FR1064]|uniref:Uncharacterized protein n=1 Tax=Glaciecola nitratireducens (strain JCM 12485 / KCTC 12276 / FR1064) TaxID=1085623 RepID=G4QEE8_GLANF|nr:hypothetical protein GNIT_0016 [Glaciecola nitratireducens FR1064]
MSNCSGNYRTSAQRTHPLRDGKLNRTEIQFISLNFEIIARSIHKNRLFKN